MTDHGEDVTPETAKTELEDLRQELAAANAIMVGLSQELLADRVETTVRVEGLRAEQQRERRIRMMAVVAGGYSAISAYDQHVEHCSPGHRVVNGIDALLKTPPKPDDDPNARTDVFTNAYDHASAACDITLPFHTHDGSPWPTANDGAGLAILALVALAAVAYHRYRTRQDFSRVQKAVEQEENRAR